MNILQSAKNECGGYMIENFQQPGSENFIPEAIVSGLTNKGSAFVGVCQERENQISEVISKRITIKHIYNFKRVGIIQLREELGNLI